MSQTHITLEMLHRAEQEDDVLVLYQRMERHLSEICSTCKQAFREHKLQELSWRHREWILEPLHTIQPPESVQEQLHQLRLLSAQERLEWAGTPSAQPSRSQEELEALALGLLLEARHAFGVEQMDAWADTAQTFLEAQALSGPRAVALEILATAYKAESFLSGDRTIP